MLPSKFIATRILVPVLFRRLLSPSRQRLTDKFSGGLRSVLWTSNIDTRACRADPFSRCRVNLRTQKRLASAVAGCGKRKIWLDPNEVNEISNANSRATVRKLISDGLIIRKPVTMHSRSRARELTAARRIGCHRGLGKRKGTADARMPR